MTLNELAKQAYEAAKEKGFHSQTEVTTEVLAKHVANLHSEISEFWEAVRLNKLNEPCDKAEGMKLIGNGEYLDCKSEEFADLILRALDTAYTLGIDLDRAVSIKIAYNKTRPFRHGNKLA